MKIDIQQKTELTIIPAFSIGIVIFEYTTKYLTFGSNCPLDLSIEDLL